MNNHLRVADVSQHNDFTPAWSHRPKRRDRSSWAQLKPASSHTWVIGLLFPYHQNKTCSCDCSVENLQSHDLKASHGLGNYYSLWEKGFIQEQQQNVGHPLAPINVPKMCSLHQFILPSYRQAGSKLMTKSLPPKKPSSYFLPLQRCQIEEKKASRPFDDTISVVRPVWFENHPPLHEDRNVPRCVQNIIMPSKLVIGLAADDNLKIVASCLETAWVPERHLSYVAFYYCICVQWTATHCMAYELRKSLTPEQYECSLNDSL